jgi:hypothetical protein
VTPVRSLCVAPGAVEGLGTYRREERNTGGSLRRRECQVSERALPQLSALDPLQESTLARSSAEESEVIPGIR